MASLRSAWELARQAGKDYMEDKGARLAAALAYYALFAIAPLLLVLIAVAGLVWGAEDVERALTGQASALVGAEGGEFIASMVERTGEGRSGLAGAALGTVILLFGATGVFVQLQDALNTVWEVKPRPDLSVWERIQRRVGTFGIVMAVAFLLLVSLAASAAVASLSRWNDALPGSDLLWGAMDAALSVAVLTLLFGLMFKAVPDAEVGWRGVAVGAFVTALLFSAGKLALGHYLGRPGAMDTFGAAGALIVVIVWVYYCAQLTLLGAEFTQAYARRHGGIHPDEDAVAVAEESRLQQGLT